MPHYAALFFSIIVLFVSGTQCTLASTNVNHNLLATTPPAKQAEGNDLSSEETKIVSFGPTQTAESLRLHNLFDYGFQDMAIGEALKDLQQDPQDIDIRQTLATFYSQQKKENLANEQLQLAELWKTWNSGNQSLAMSQAIKLNSKNPNNSEINYALGYFYFSQKNYLLASQAFESALRIAPQFTAARAALVNVYIATGNYSQATTTLNQELDQNNRLLKEEEKLIQHAQNTALENANTDFNQFISIWRLWDSGNRQEAINQTVIYLKKNPDQRQITLSLGQFYLLEKNYPLASQQLIPLLEKNPNYVAARAAVIDLYLASNKPQQAEDIVDQGLILSPINTILLDKKKAINNYGSNTAKGAAASLAEFESLWKIWNSGQQSEAIAQAKSFLSNNPDDLRIGLVLGQFYALQKKYPEAIQQYNWILTKNPTYIAARVGLSDAYSNSKNYEMATKVIEQGLALIPDNRELLLAKQSIAGLREFDSLWQLWNQGKSSEAINQAKDYLKTHPDNTEISLSLGQFYFLQKDYLSASQQINAILVKDPDYILARISLIDVYLAMKDYARANSLLQEGLKRAPQNSSLLAEEKIIANAQNKVSQAALPQVTTQKTGQALAEFNALWQLWKLGKKSIAIANASEYLKQNPDDTAVRLSLGQFYFLEKNYALAQYQIRQTLAKDPNYIAAYASLIEVYIALKDYSQATELVNQGLKLAPGDPVLLAEKKAINDAKNPTLAAPVNDLAEFNSLWQLWKSGKKTEAIERATSYLQKNPGDAPISLSLGQFYYLQKQYPQAEQQISRVLSQDPKYIAARTSLIDVYIALKNYQKATNLLQQGLKISPGDRALLEEEKVINAAKNPPSGAVVGSGLAEFNALWELWKADKQSQAIERASSYLQKNPNDEAVALSLGQFYFLQKNYEQATQKITQILNKNPGYVAARTSLIDIYLATKNYVQATTILNQGLALSPADSSLLQYKQLIKNTQNGVAVALAQPGQPQYGSYVEGGALYSDLTGGYEHWFNQYLKAVIQKDPNNVWVAEYLHGYEFGQKADYGLIQETHNFNENWYGTFGAGVSDNSIYVPKYYLGGTLARRLLKSKQLITYLQAQAYWFRPVYKLEVLNPGLIYYFEKPWILESGVYLNRSNPGRVDTAVGYLAVTQGRDKEHFLTLRLAWGREGYLPLANNAPVVGYPSVVATGTWRQWLGHHWGWNVIAENYHNRFYNRYTVSFGLFKEFSV